MISILKNQYVPVAVDNYLPGDRAEEEFYEKTGCVSNGYIVVAASGTKVGNAESPGDLEKLLEDYRKLPEGDRKPKIEKAQGASSEKVPPQPPPGTLTLISYCTSLEKRGEREFKRCGTVMGPGPTWPINPSITANDLLWITQGEAKAMAPENPRKGDKLPVPESLKRRMFLYYGFDGIHNCAVADKIRGGELALTVEEVSADRVRLRLEGYGKIQTSFEEFKNCKGDEGRDIWHCAHFGAEMSYLGFLDYDRQKGAFDRFDIVALGDVWGFGAEFTRTLEESPQTRGRWPTGWFFQLASDRPADRKGWPVAVPAYREGANYWQGAR